MTPELGIIEGFFGRPWSWADRAWAMRRLAAAGYAFHIYAPKADAFLRRRWAEPHPPEDARALAAFGADCRASGVRFGVGLSPFELYLGFDGPAREALERKLAALDEIGVQDLALLFDDMKGDVDGLAERQAEIVDFVAARTVAGRLIVAPTYYTDDPVLDRVFGPRPERYLEQLGELLDPGIGLFWTGEEVCARELSPGHFARVASLLQRKPVLWDNYPVNDGPRMSRRLHLRAVTGRPASIGAEIAAHAVNPALQPVLSCIPALTLPMSYRLGGAYEYGRAFIEAATEIAGPEIAAALQRDLAPLQDAGLAELSAERIRALRARYAAFDHPAAREVVAFLDGAWIATDADMQT